MVASQGGTMLFALALVGALVAYQAYSFARRTQSPAAPLAGTLAAALLLFAVSRAFTVIPAGHVGIVDFFGRVAPDTLKSGINLVNPFARIVRMSIKTQEAKEVMDVPSKEGLTVQLEVSVLYHLDPEKASEVYKTVAPDYEAVILAPQFRSVTRGVTAGYEARALYTSEREQLAHAIAEEVKKLVGPRGVVVESTPLRKLTLPARLAAAIEEELGAEQESQRMQFVLTKE